MGRTNKKGVCVGVDDSEEAAFTYAVWVFAVGFAIFYTLGSWYGWDR